MNLGMDAWKGAIGCVNRIGCTLTKDAADKIQNLSTESFWKMLTQAQI